MRAFRNLECLAAAYDVTLLVIPTGLRSASPAEASRLCASIIVLPVRPRKNPPLALRLVLIRILGRSALGRRWPFELRSLTRGRLREAAGLLAGKEFDLIHTFRIYLSPYAFHLRRTNSASIIEIDLDDFESRVRREQSELMRQAGRRKMSMRLQREAEAYERIERRWLGRFDRVFVCSENDRRKLGEAYGELAIEVLPNVIVQPEHRVAERAAAPFVFLFIGTFSYFPNADGLKYLCGRVLPLLRGKNEKPFVIQVVGAGISRWQRLRLLFDRHIRFIGWVPQIETFYNGAGAVLVPIRTGGGTRIKVIEAVAHQLPVISTSKGIEGLKFEPGIDALIGDTPEEIAGCCLALLKDDDLRERLRTNALAVFQKYYRPDNLRPVLNKEPAAANKEIKRSESIGVRSRRVVAKIENNLIK